MTLGLAVLRVSVYRGGELVGAEHFRERHIIVGRDPTMADLVIGSGKVSREHALLEHDGLRIFVHDLGSTNGVFLNGLRVDRAEVGPSDRVFVGEHHLRLELRGRVLVPEPDLSELPELPDPGWVDRSAADEVADGAPPDLTLLPLSIPTAEHARTEVADWDEEDEPPWDGPHFSVVRQLLDEAGPTSDTAVSAMRLSILKTRGDEALGHRVLRPGQRYRLRTAPVQEERWQAAAPTLYPLMVNFKVNGEAVVGVLERSPWQLRRGVGLWDEAAGIREGWARRRRGVVAVTLRCDEQISVSLGSVGYHIYFTRVPPSPRSIAQAAPQGGLSSWRWLRWPLLGSLLFHAAVVLALGVSHATSHRGLAAAPAKPPHLETLATPVDVTVAQRSEAIPMPPVSIPSAGAGDVRVPGGSQGYRLFGLIDAPASYDPHTPAPGPSVTLKRAAAFLRGDGTGLGQLIPQTGPGPQWHWVADTQDVTSSDPSRLQPAAATAVVTQNSAALQACYQKALPKDAGLSGRVTLSWLVASNGVVRTVYPGPNLIEAPLLNCLTDVIKRWRFSRFSGSDVILSYTLVFKRVGFE